MRPYYVYMPPYRKRYTKKRNIPMFGKADRYVARKAYTLAKFAVSRLNSELKFHDITTVGTTIPDGVGTIIQLSNISQGDTDVTRDGAQIKVVSLDIKGEIRTNVSASLSGSMVNIMLVLDKQTNEAIYSTVDLLHVVTNEISVDSGLNLDNKFRFQVLKRWIIPLNIAGQNRKAFSAHIRFPNNMKLRYDGNAGDITDLTSKSLSILFISNESTNTPQITFFNRIKFIDN